jgi:hypothetical protein
MEHVVDLLESLLVMVAVLAMVGLVVSAIERRWR